MASLSMSDLKTHAGSLALMQPYWLTGCKTPSKLVTYDNGSGSGIYIAECLFSSQEIQDDSFILSAYEDQPYL